MKEYLKSYVQEIDTLLNSKKKITEAIVSDHLIKIQFFQHERLVHLFVTLFYGIFTFLSFFIVAAVPYFAIISLILVVFLVAYVYHYFFLENNVQYLYKQYDKLKEKLSK